MIELVYWLLNLLLLTVEFWWFFQCPPGHWPSWVGSPHRQIEGSCFPSLNLLLWSNSFDLELFRDEMWRFCSVEKSRDENAQSFSFPAGHCPVSSVVWLSLTGFSVLIADAPCPARPSFACWFSLSVWTGGDLNGSGSGLTDMMEVAAAAPWTDVLESERNQVSGRAETLLGSSNLTLAPLMADSASVRRSQPIFITSNR